MRKSRSGGIALVVVLAGLLISCQESEDLTGVGVTVTADFEAETPPPGTTTNLVTLERGAANGRNITLDVVVSGVSEPVSGIALKLTYPDRFSKFTRCTDGDLFTTGDCFFAEPAPGSGEVFIGRSLQAPEPPVSVPGSVVIVRIEFLVFDEGVGDIVFEAQNLGGGDATALLDANGDPILVSWYAGMIRGD